MTKYIDVIYLERNQKSRNRSLDTVHTVAPQHLHEVLCIQSTAVLLERVRKLGEAGIPNSKLQKDPTVYLANSWLDMFFLE